MSFMDISRLINLKSSTNLSYVNEFFIDKYLLNIFVGDEYIDVNNFSSFFRFEKFLYLRRSVSLKRRYLFRKRYKKFYGLFRKLCLFKSFFKINFRENTFRRFFFHMTIMCGRLLSLLRTIGSSFEKSLIFRKGLFLLLKLLSLIKFQRILISNIRKFLIRRIA